MNKNRPININPLSIRLPVTALVSISHRLSGLLVFLLIPLLLGALQMSLASPEGLAQLKDKFDCLIYKSLIWLFMAGLIFHLFAGIRHIIMDLHIAESLCFAKLSAWLVFFGSLAALIAAYGIWG